MTVTIVTNNHQRELLAGAAIPEKVYSEWFDYCGPYVEENETLWESRFFSYRGSWYDVHEFERATGELLANGFDGVQSDTYFSGIAIRYGKHWDGTSDYDSVIVARIAFLDD